jgi:hypothetical protein
MGEQRKGPFEDKFKIRSIFGALRRFVSDGGHRRFERWAGALEGRVFDALWEGKRGGFRPAYK